jgi:signal transduction histidine kinase
MDEGCLRKLLDVGRSLVKELDPEVVLRRLLDVAREVTGARYAAIGVLDERREALERFVTAGIDDETHRAIGDLPRGRGLLGVLIREPRPLRLADVGAHPQSYGFPFAHPPMASFLGVPILVQGEAWGNLYLTETGGGEFTAGDEEAAIVLADWAAIALTNARLYRAVHERRDELERAIRGLETTTEVSRALGGVTDIDRVLELVVERSRALLDARAAEIALLDGDEFVIAGVAGEGTGNVVGTRLPIEGSLAGSALRTGRIRRFDKVPADSFAHRVMGATTAIVTPMIFKSRPVGFLVVFDRLGAPRPFNDDDERLLEAFAASAATAVATAQTATDQALRQSIEASESERGRWARELHDETLQQLAGLRVMLSGARRSGDPERLAATVDDAVGLITTGIADLRALITDLRPAALDELGAQAALETLVERVGAQSGLEVALEIDLAYEASETEARHVEQVESTIYRLVQEALTNVIKHAAATRVEVSVSDRGGVVEIRVRDDGGGFDDERPAGGFGLVGMRERVGLLHGTLEIHSSPGAGTALRATFPVRRRPGPRLASTG